MSPLRWQETARHGKARSGVLHLARGAVRTPAFMPVGTLGAVRGGIHAEEAVIVNES